MLCLSRGQTQQTMKPWPGVDAVALSREAIRQWGEANASTMTRMIHLPEWEFRRW
jgi:hypothetical protein